MVTLLTYVCLTGATLGALACLAIRSRRTIATVSDTICALSPAKKVTLLIMLAIAVVHGGGKTNTQDNVDGGLTNLLTGALRSLAHFINSADDIHYPPVTDEDLTRGWQRLGPFTNANVAYSMPDGAALARNWWLRGAFEDVTKIGLEGLGGLERCDSIWAFSWGKVRFALNDTNEAVAVGAPMSAIPFSSRLWSAADTNGAFRVTWENFTLGRAHSGDCQLVSAQIEFRANGDYVTRSNELETVWRHIDPDDFDGDGYRNDDDPNPLEWDDGADAYYGPANELPQGCNEDAYCDVTVEVGGTNSQWVSFTGDGYSNYSDPLFFAKPGVPYDVKILIGKTYRVTCDAPIQAIGTSDDNIEIWDADTNAFTVVWPVTITEASAPLFAPPPGRLGAPSGGQGFSLSIYPDWLNGIVSWPSNCCCQIVCKNGLYRFSCQDACTCCGCTLTGAYLYEGYSLAFGEIRCGCHYEPDDNTSFEITAPSAVFKDGALRPISVSFNHSNEDARERGTLTLAQISGNGKVRIWADEARTAEATTFSWDVSSFEGCTYYLEGVERSDSVDDILFELTWTRPDGISVNRTDTTTCAEVKETQVTSPTDGITDGSPNPQPFAGHTNWNFNVSHSPRPDKHYSVLFRDAVNPDFSVRDFSVRMTLVVDPPDAPVGTASWFPLDPTPQSGSIVSTGARIGELRNPKVGGVYHIGSCFAGSPTNECNIVLPLAGAEMYGILASDLGWADRFAETGRERLPRRWLERVKFGCKWFSWLENGFYRGRPDNHQHPTVWHYNQIRDFDGLGAVGTLRGHPIRAEKLSNFIAGYTCVKIGVPWHERVLAQAIGTTNDLAATLSWQAGEYVANNVSLDLAISNFVANAHLDSDEKTGKLWPNTAPVDNHRGYPGHGDFDREFLSPGFIYAQP